MYERFNQKKQKKRKKELPPTTHAGTQGIGYG
jgi:hypothetical protein